MKLLAQSIRPRIRQSTYFFIQIGADDIQRNQSDLVVQIGFVDIVFVNDKLEKRALGVHVH